MISLHAARGRTAGLRFYLRREKFARNQGTASSTPQTPVSTIPVWAILAPIGPRKSRTRISSITRGATGSVSPGPAPLDRESLDDSGRRTELLDLSLAATQAAALHALRSTDDRRSRFLPQLLFGQACGLLVFGGVGRDGFYSEQVAAAEPPDDFRGDLRIADRQIHDAAVRIVHPPARETCDRDLHL